jgi:putative SOS response-associated peptidase YedK
MCGRFSLHLAELAELRNQLGVSRVLITDWHPRYNIAPSQLVPVVTADDAPGERAREPERVLRALRWGLVLADEPRKAAGGMINARVESLPKWSSIRSAFRERRCIVPATGYYEWRPEPDRRAKQPLWIHPEDGSVMALAGVWSETVSEDGEVVDTFAIVTTEAPDALRSIHDRVPLELRGQDVDRWLAPGALSGKALEAMVEAARDVGHLRADEVGTRVNTPAHDDAQCIAPRAAADPEHLADAQLSLFGRRGDT